MGARYYDPTFGCFLTRDTELSQSPYVYCDGDPVNFSDPSGHSWAALGGFLGFAVGTVILAAVIVLIAPEAAVGAGLYVVANAAFVAEPLATIIVAVPTVGGGTYYGTLIGEGVDDARPKKGGGGVSPGDASKTEAEGEGNGPVQGATSVPNPTTYDDYNGDNQQISGPYTGTPHYPVHDIPH